MAWACASETFLLQKTISHHWRVSPPFQCVKTKSSEFYDRFCSDSLVSILSQAVAFQDQNQTSD